MTWIQIYLYIQAFGIQFRRGNRGTYKTKIAKFNHKKGGADSFTLLSVCPCSNHVIDFTKKCDLLRWKKMEQKVHLIPAILALINPCLSLNIEKLKGFLLFLPVKSFKSFTSWKILVKNVEKKIVIMIIFNVSKSICLLRLTL